MRLSLNYKDLKGEKYIGFINKKKRVCQNANIILMILQFETIQ